MTKIKANTKAFVGESAVSLLESGDVSAALCWDYPTLCGDSKDNWDTFDFTALEGGCECFTQYWAIPSASNNKEKAQKLIDFILQPKELAKCYSEYALTPTEPEDVIGKYLPKDYYKNPAIEGMKPLYDPSWKIAIDEKQIDIMDKYYTQLKGEE